MLCGFELLLYQLADRAFPLCPCCYASTEAAHRGADAQRQGAGGTAVAEVAAGVGAGEGGGAAEAAQPPPPPLLQSKKCPLPVSCADMWPVICHAPLLHIVHVPELH